MKKQDCLKTIDDLKIQVKSLLIYKYYVNNQYKITIYLTVFMLFLLISPYALKGDHFFLKISFIQCFILGCFISFFVSMLITFLSLSIEQKSDSRFIIFNKLKKSNHFLLLTLYSKIIVYEIGVIASFFLSKQYHFFISY